MKICLLGIFNCVLISFIIINVLEEASGMLMLHDSKVLDLFILSGKLQLGEGLWLGPNVMSCAT